MELEQLGIRGANPTQALLLLKLGHSATSMTGLTLSGYYQGTNPSYNVKQLIEGGFVTRDRRSRDRRSSYLRLTEKGHHLRRQLIAHYRRQAELLENELLSADTLAATASTLRQIEQVLVSVTESAPVQRRPRRPSTRNTKKTYRDGGRSSTLPPADKPERHRSTVAALAKSLPRL